MALNAADCSFQGCHSRVDTHTDLITNTVLDRHILAVGVTRTMATGPSLPSRFPLPSAARRASGARSRGLVQLQQRSTPSVCQCMHAGAARMAFATNIADAELTARFTKRKSSSAMHGEPALYYRKTLSDLLKLAFCQ